MNYCWWIQRHATYININELKSPIEGTLTFKLHLKNEDNKDNDDDDNDDDDDGDKRYSSGCSCGAG